jgi:hypothetical protein
MSKQQTAKPVPAGTRVDVTASEVEVCADAIRARLRQAIINFKHSGEIGRISGLMSDLRALDYVDPTKGDAKPAVSAPAVDARTAARQAAASDDALMQKQNVEMNRKERAEASKEEGIKE